MNDYIGNAYSNSKNETVNPMWCVGDLCGVDISDKCLMNFCKTNSRQCFLLFCDSNFECDILGRIGIA